MNMVSLEPSKMTQNMLRWSTYVEKDDARFELYIPKWRVPGQWPGLIRVRIEAYQGDPAEFEESPYHRDRLEDPIRVLVRRVSKLSSTMKYAPVGDSETWQIGKPYIPHSLVVEDSNLLAIEVEWDLSTNWEFDAVSDHRLEPRLGRRG